MVWRISGIYGQAEAAVELGRAQELDPLSLIINVALGWVYYLGRRHDDAIQVFLRTLELDPQLVQARSCLGLAYVQKKMYAEAITELEKAVDIAGRDPSLLATLAFAYGTAGNKIEALKLVAEITEQSLQRYVSPYRLALAYGAIDDKEQAFDWLRKGCEEHDPGLAGLKVEPMADPLRNDPRYLESLQRMGFPA